MSQKISIRNYVMETKKIEERDWKNGYMSKLSADAVHLQEILPHSSLCSSPKFINFPYALTHNTLSINSGRRKVTAGPRRHCNKYKPFCLWHSCDRTKRLRSQRSHTCNLSQANLCSSQGGLHDLCHSFHSPIFASLVPFRQVGPWWTFQTVWRVNDMPDGIQRCLQLFIHSLMPPLWFSLPCLGRAHEICVPWVKNPPF